MMWILWFVSWFGFPLTMIGTFWIAISTIMSGNVLWGVLSFCAPFGLFQGFMNYSKFKVPTIMMCIGLGLLVLYGMLNISS